MTLSVHQLSTQSGRLPFDCSLDGFNHDWWCDASARRGHEYLTIVRGEVEVARAEVNPHSTDLDDYAGMDLPTTVVKIEFFEVREKLRLQGVGRAVVDAIIDRYKGRWLTVASAEAGAFWTALGWTEARHIRRPEMPSSRYLLHASI